MRQSARRRQGRTGGEARMKTCFSRILICSLSTGRPTEIRSIRIVNRSHCRPTGHVNARRMTAIEAIHRARKRGCFCSLARRTGGCFAPHNHTFRIPGADAINSAQSEGTVDVSACTGVIELACDVVRRTRRMVSLWLTLSASDSARGPVRRCGGKAVHVDDSSPTDGDRRGSGRHPADPAAWQPSDRSVSASAMST